MSFEKPTVEELTSDNEWNKKDKWQALYMNADNQDLVEIAEGKHYINYQLRAKRELQRRSDIAKTEEKQRFNILAWIGSLTLIVAIVTLITTIFL